MRKFENIERLREVLLGLTHHSAFYSDGRDVDNSKAVIQKFRKSPPAGEFFLCDCIGNTVDLCYSTKKAYKNADGRTVNCKVIETIIPDARKQLGSPVNGCWQIPYHLL